MKTINTFLILCIEAIIIIIANGNKGFLIMNMIIFSAKKNDP